jgi:hypothetical protein
VTGFSVSRGHKLLERDLNVLGNGTMLGAARVNHGTAEVIEAWFRAHPAFGQQETPAAVQPRSLMSFGSWLRSGKKAY